jgi:hypothetical protein
MDKIFHELAIIPVTGKLSRYSRPQKTENEGTSSRPNSNTAAIVLTVVIISDYQR